MTQQSAISQKMELLIGGSAWQNVEGRVGVNDCPYTM
jgi:hypothetical protein